MIDLTERRKVLEAHIEIAERINLQIPSADGFVSNHDWHELVVVVPERLRDKLIGIMRQAAYRPQRNPLKTLVFRKQIARDIAVSVAIYH